MNAVVLTFDCLPVRLLGCYGNQSVDTPNFDRLAANAIAFDSHFGEDFAPATENHAWWTGRYQFPRTREQQRSQTSLQQMLSHTGVACQIIAEHSTIDEFVDHARMSLQQFAANEHAPKLLWLKAAGLTSSELNENAAIARVDEMLGHLLTCVDEWIGNDDTLLMVTASRGSRLSRSIGKSTPSIELNESLVQVPMFVRAPTGEMGNRRNCLTQSVDLLPTLLEWLQVDAAQYAIEGRSILPLVASKSAGEREYVCLGCENRERAIRTRDFYLIERLQPAQSNATADLGGEGSGTVHLFKKPDDRFDVHDVANQFPDECEKLRGTLETFVRSLETIGAR